MSEHLTVDAADRRVAAGYAAILGALVGPVLLGLSHPRLLGPVPWWWPLLAAVACGALNTVLPLRRGRRDTAVVYAAMWVLPAGWLAYGYGHRHHSGHYWAADLGVTAVLVVAAYVYALPANFGAPMAPTALALPPPGPDVAPDVAAWTARLRDPRIGKAPGATVADIRLWPQRTADGRPTGYTVTGEAGAGEGDTWEKIAERSRAITANLRLPRGCAADVGPGPDDGTEADYRIDVATVDTLAGERTYTDTSPLSGNGLIPVGWYPNDDRVLLPVRQQCCLSIGEPGSGKSNFLHDLTCGYVRCPDVLVWHIDLGGAGLALPWAWPWLDGRLTRPAADWAAPDLDEAILMTALAVEVILARRSVYAGLMLSRNTDMVPCSADLPQIRIVLDESAEAAGASAHPALVANLTRIVQLGRGAGVRLDLGGLRATATITSTDIQQLISIRTVFAVTDEAEVGRALGWYTKLRLASLPPHPGAGWIRVGSSAPVRRYRTERAALPDTIAAVAAACDSRRPGWAHGSQWSGLDEPSLAQVTPELRDAYLSRWDRVAPKLTPGGLTPVGGSPAAPGGAHAPGSPGSPARLRVAGGGSPPGLTVPGMGTVHAATERLKRWAADRRLAAMPDHVAEERFAELAAAFGDDPGGQPETGGAETPTRPDARARARQLVADAGDTGISGPKLHEQLRAEGYGMSLSTLYDWLRADCVDGGYKVWRSKPDPDPRSEQ